MPFDIITIGAATRDVFLISNEIKLFPSETFITGIGECVALGTKIELDRLVLSTGGGATNAAVTFGRLGLKTACVTRIGDDCDGTACLTDLQQAKVDSRFVRRIPNGQTIFSALLTEPKGGERTVLVYRDAKMRLAAQDVLPACQRAKWLYMTSLSTGFTLAKIIILQFGKEKRICWNPGQAEIQKGLTAFQPLFSRLFLLNLNREEATQLFGKKDPLRFIPPTLLLVITDGANGARAWHKGKSWFVAASKKRAVSRTGAGDAFGSGLVAGLIKGWDIADALRLGLLNAESVIQHYGAKTGLLQRWPTERELCRVPVKNYD